MMSRGRLWEGGTDDAQQYVGNVRLGGTVVVLPVHGVEHIGGADVQVQRCIAWTLQISGFLQHHAALLTVV